MACSGPDVLPILTETVEIEVPSRANEDNAISVDVVLAFDVSLAQQLAGLTAALWFKTRDQILLANPTGFEVISFELVPGQSGPRFEVSGRNREAVGAFVFAGYASPGPHRARIDGIPSVRVRLGVKDFTVVPVPP